MITELENSLFVRWSLGRKDFVSDGVADEKAFTSSALTVLFVMKEVNDLGGGGWDLREYMREGGRGQSWNNITRWVEGIRSLPVDIPWEELSVITEERRRSALTTVASMNLKKSPGHHTTNPVELAEWARKDMEYLNEQFSIYSADIVICCGTDVSNNLHAVVKVLKGADWKLTSRGVYFHEYMPNKFLICYSHPAARVSSNLLHYGLIDAIREITQSS